MTTGTVFEIKRFAVHDGPGVRTALFLKGCSLRCRWCHNPEGISAQPALAYYAHKCVHCGECVNACPAGAHRILDGKHLFDRNKCTACGACESVCLGRALTFFGKKISADKAVRAVLDDRDFYREGGGCTISGGEPLLQADFCQEVFRRLKEHGIHCAIDTSGAVPWSAFEKVLPHTDMFLYDVKHPDSEKHREHTGLANDLILDNLRKLSGYGIPVEIRIPVIPGFNDDRKTIGRIAELLSALDNIKAVKLLPFHAFARSKYAALDMADTTPVAETPSPELMRELRGSVSTTLLGG